MGGGVIHLKTSQGVWPVLPPGGAVRMRALPGFSIRTHRSGMLERVDGYFKKSEKVKTSRAEAELLCESFLRRLQRQRCRDVK